MGLRWAPGSQNQPILIPFGGVGQRRNLVSNELIIRKEKHSNGGEKDAYDTVARKRKEQYRYEERQTHIPYYNSKSGNSGPNLHWKDGRDKT